MDYTGSESRDEGTNKVNVNGENMDYTGSESRDEGSNKRACPLLHQVSFFQIISSCSWETLADREKSPVCW
ncbi:hypothetical protein E2562_011107 [Oryza meyeriana var. granulata]|uniref:Uncharacterized protein n=1 Tax=Oryza meyeriana var. granulata TaxID=110450 RepID=A0A6G1EWJ3_9ORYZ|nr:hypothetical protein E2562_011107 [Oryza meyeriana var. granulata]